MSNGFFNVPTPENEPVRDYEPGSPARESLKAQLAKMANEQIEIPIIIGGREIRTGNMGDCRMPHDHGHLLGKYHKADESHVAEAAKAANEAWQTWSNMPWEHRASIFLKAGDLLAGPYRDVLNAATMLGQSKTCFQAEIDSACELIDFFRFNPSYMTNIFRQQPLYSPTPTWNRSAYRALEGFILAITPFNFTSIAANLPSSPALMGNTVLWKPAASAVYSGYYIMKLLEEAGMPPGVINFIPGPAQAISDTALSNPDFAGVHFTGSTAVFNHIWRTVGNHLETYRCYPRLVGETGGKDYIFAHESADLDALAVAIVRGSFEFQGQKCSASSRAYVPTTIWPQVRDRAIALIKEITMGDVCDFTNFMGAVIDAKAFEKISGYQQAAKNANDAKVIAGGGSDNSRGYFIEPTLIETENPKFLTLCEEIFGPVMTVHPYQPNTFEDTLALCDQTSPYALTGAIFAQDRQAIITAEHALTHSAGNFYINDKPTGAVVGQQPFGGARASGTNDKAGSMLNLLRWTNARSIKENFVPPKSLGYPHMRAE